MNQNADVSNFDVPEYLPKCKTYVDLLRPENMSPAQILELFSRRGFISLVSSDDPFDRLVDLYYDHIMPMPPSKKLTVTTPTASEKHLNGEHKQTTLSTSNSCRSMKRPPPPDTRLEDLIITSDPRRFTPGFSSAEANRAERVLTVRKPKSFINGLPNASNGASSNQQKISPPNVTNEDVQEKKSTQSVESIPKKRVKLKRDFSNLI